MASARLDESDNTVLTLSDEETKALWLLLGKLSHNSKLEKGLTEEQAKLVSDIWHSLR